MHLTSSPIDWYAARAGGIAAYVLLTVVVSLGLGLAGRKRLERWPRFALEDVHRFGGLLVGAFIAIHVGAIAVDAWLPFSPAALVVPLVSRYRPLWTALGIVAAELLIAIAVTNRLRDRIPYRFWRRAHYLNFAVWGAATLHGLGSGTDRSAPWLITLYAVSVATVMGLVTVRVTRSRALRPVLGALAGAGVLAVVLLAAGPLRSHPRPWNARSFHDSLSGRVLRDFGATRGLLSVAAVGSGEQHALLRADLLVEPGRFDATSLQLELLPSALVCRGRVTHVENFGFDGVCTGPDGIRRSLSARWSASDGPIFTGTLDAHA